MANSCVDCHIKDLVDTTHLFAAAFDIGSAHLLRYTLALLWRYGCQTLSFEEINAGALVAEIGFEADKDQRSCWAKVKDFWIPLFIRQKKTVVPGNG